MNEFLLIGFHTSPGVSRLLKMPKSSHKLKRNWKKIH